jgi:hypothetical protein
MTRRQVERLFLTVAILLALATVWVLVSPVLLPERMPDCNPHSSGWAGFDVCGDL